MSIVFVEVRKTAQRQNRYTCNNRRGYVSWPLVGTQCETNVLRHVCESKNLRAPSDWPRERPNFKTVESSLLLGGFG